MATDTLDWQGLHQIVKITKDKTGFDSDSINHPYLGIATAVRPYDLPSGWVWMDDLDKSKFRVIEENVPTENPQIFTLKREVVEI